MFILDHNDQDGDLDVYMASPRSSVLLINSNGRYAVIDPSTVGLPTQALTANWVDYDNDGLMDLHILPGGLYRQNAAHQFVETSLVQSNLSASTVLSTDLKVSRALSTWFDLDNNGTRDALCVVKHYSPPQNTLYRNAINQNHWLQVQLVGPQKNRQAIGAKVIVETPDGKQLQQVGTADGAHYSQGHYRLYFRLGQHDTIKSIQVIWSDGAQQTIQPPTVDQLLTSSTVCWRSVSSGDSSTPLLA